MPETITRSPSRVEQTTAQHTNGPTAQEDSSPSETQNVGGIVASLMGGDHDDPTSAQGTSPGDPVTATDPAGVVASLLAAAGSTWSTQQGSHADPAVVQTAPSSDPRDTIDPSPTQPRADETAPDISSSVLADIIATDTHVHHPQPNESTLTEETALPSNYPTVSASDITPPGPLSTPSANDPHHPISRPVEAIIPLGSSSSTVVSGQPLVVLDHTLSVGGEAATVDGQLISMATEGVVVDGATVAFSTGSPAVGDTNATASVSQSMVMYTGVASSKRTARRSWIILAMFSAILALL